MDWKEFKYQVPTHTACDFRQIREKLSEMDEVVFQKTGHRPNVLLVRSGWVDRFKGVPYEVRPVSILDDCVFLGYDGEGELDPRCFGSILMLECDETFRPYVYHGQNSVTAVFAPDADFSERLTSDITVYRSFESGSIVGCKIFLGGE